MTFNLPQHNFSRKFINLHKNFKQKGILGQYMPRPSFPDEPHFFYYACERTPSYPSLKKGYGYGCNEDNNLAFQISVCEAIEHHCIICEQENLFICDSYLNLADRAINPLRFIPFRNIQLKDERYKKFRITHNSKINWMLGHSLTSKKRVF